MNKTPAGPKPSARQETALAFDSARGRTVLFGGFDEAGWRQDTWEWDGTRWEQKTPSSAIPGARRGHALAYDALRGRVVLFGGASDVSRYQDTWEWDGTQWVEVTPAGSSPAERSYHAMAYDSGRGRIVLFGGFGAARFQDTWEWDGTSPGAWSDSGAGWDQAGPAEARHAMAYDSARRPRGRVRRRRDSSGALQDTWEWSPGGGSLGPPSGPLSLALQAALRAGRRERPARRARPAVALVARRSARVGVGATLAGRGRPAAPSLAVRAARRELAADRRRRRAGLAITCRAPPAGKRRVDHGYCRGGASLGGCCSSATAKLSRCRAAARGRARATGEAAVALDYARGPGALQRAVRRRGAECASGFCDSWRHASLHASGGIGELRGSAAGCASGYLRPPGPRLRPAVLPGERVRRRRPGLRRRATATPGAHVGASGAAGGGCSARRPGARRDCRSHAWGLSSRTGGAAGWRRVRLGEPGARRATATRLSGHVCSSGAVRRVAAARTARAAGRASCSTWTYRCAAGRAGERPARRGGDCVHGRTATGLERSLQRRRDYGASVPVGLGSAGMRATCGPWTHACRPCRLPSGRGAGSGERLPDRATAAPWSRSCTIGAAGAECVQLGRGLRSRAICSTWTRGCTSGAVE